jgi:hypothetical protein
MLSGEQEFEEDGADDDPCDEPAAAAGGDVAETPLAAAAAAAEPSFTAAQESAREQDASSCNEDAFHALLGSPPPQRTIHTYEGEDDGPHQSTNRYYHAYACLEFT